MEKEENNKEKETIEEEVKVPLRGWAHVDENQERLDKLILDAGVNKYDLIILARRWAYELKTREGEVRSVQELIPDSVRDILTAKVNSKTIRDLPQLRFLAKKLKGPAAAIFDNIGKTPPNSENDSPKDGKSKKK